MATDITADLYVSIGALCPTGTAALAADLIGQGWTADEAEREVSAFLAMGRLIVDGECVRPRQ